MMRYILVFVCALPLLACASAAIAAQPAASGNQVTPSWTEEFSATSGGVDIGGGVGTGVYLDPDAGPWQKIIFGIFVSPLPIRENLVILPDPSTVPPPPGGPPWTDWDELILTPGWGWGGNPTATITEPDQTVKNVAGIIKTIVNPNDFVEFDFNPAENPGARLTIIKSLVWLGPGPMPQPGTVVINEYPTPEPGTIVLLISGLLALGFGYIRRR
jgi:hypothetical protein